MESTITSPTETDSAEAIVANKPLRVLVAEDSENDVIILLHTLRKAGYEPVYERVSTAPAMKAALAQQTWDIVISDYEMPNFGGFEALQLLKESGRDLPFILVSAVVSEERAVMAMKAGAHDYIMKRKLTRLAPAIERELREAQTRAAHKAAEDALRQSEVNLQHTQKMEAVGRLAASVAHDFNNVLTAILGHSDMLLRQFNADDPRRKNTEEIKKCTQMASVLTKQLLALSRKQAVDPRLLELNSVILNIETILRRLVGKDIELRAELGSATGCIKADPSQIEQVIMNLVVNARDAMPDGGKLTVSTTNTTSDDPELRIFTDLRPGDYVVLAITDTGTGMSEEVKRHLFEPFFTTKAPGKGTGLGLATSFGIIKQNNGHVKVQSEQGKGTTFTIYFPRIQAATQ